ncbi:MAG: hypothetical protein DRI57_24065 [Deltaproteobacteria bacterium]|nr:MAG: hypothetical protein DRI57_24065 [Deltaproteobacteria bacterium]
MLPAAPGSARLRRASVTVTIIADGYYSLQDLRSQAGAWERECALRQAQGTGDDKPVVEPVETNHVSGSYMLPVPQQVTTLSMILTAGARRSRSLRTGSSSLPCQF